MQSPADLTSLYRENGRKVTSQRLAVFDALWGNEGHPSAEAVHARVTERLPSVSLRTVYSVLGELVELGELQSFDLGTGSARFDPNHDPHHHLVCERCGDVRDVQLDRDAVRPSDAPSEFRINGTEVVFRGICGRCLELDDSVEDADPPTSGRGNRAASPT